MMKYINKALSYFMLLTLILTVASFTSAAVSEKEFSLSKFYSSQQRLICISHRGDTVNYPENSLVGVKSALEKGADFVSVNLEKTADDEFYLCEDESLGNVCDAPYESLGEINSDEVKNYSLFDVYGNKTEYKLTSLVELISQTNSKDGIILDVKSEHKDEVYSILLTHDALDRMIIRVNESASKLVRWSESKDKKAHVIAVYGGNVIFNTVSALKNLTEAEMLAVQYNSKNYFNVAYGSFFSNRYLKGKYCRAVAATYSPDLCGQRGDSNSGWDELIKKGYSVIETNATEAFEAYEKETERLESEIIKLIMDAAEVDSLKYSEVSLSNLAKAKKDCEELLQLPCFSLDEAQSAYSELVFALKEMKISSGEIDTRGALNVTAGKVVAAVLVGAALLAGQIFVYKMRKDKKNKGEL